MAVYKRSYRPYDGPLTSERWRFLAVPRYAIQDVFESRLLSGFLVLCLAPFLAEAVAIYVWNSAPARALLRLPAVAPAELLSPQFFLYALTGQGVLAFVLTAWVAPLLVAPDVVNGALPLYLSRPFSRAEYVLGKATVLLTLLSLITWVPGLLLFGLQAGVGEERWLAQNARVGWATLVGGWIWIVVLTLLGLALSAWTRLRLVSTGLLFGVFGMGTAFGEAWHEVLGSPWGRLANLPYLIGLVWTDLFGFNAPRAQTGETEILPLPSGGGPADLPVWAAWLVLAAVSGFSLWLLDRRLRAREVHA